MSVLKPSVRQILADKKTFNPELENVIKKLSLSKTTNVLGSYRLKSQLYPSDIDLYSSVKSTPHDIQTKIQKITRDILNDDTIYFTDCKLGLNLDLKIIDDSSYIHNGVLYRYDYKHSMMRLEEVKHKITKEQYFMAKRLLKPKPNQKQLNEINKKLRFHLLRWSPNEILRGYKMVPGDTKDRKYTLAMGFKSPALFKIDVIALINDKYTDVTCIYDLRTKTNRRINKHALTTEQQIYQDIEKFKLAKQYFRVLKRQFALSKYKYKYNKNSLTKRISLAKQIGQLHKLLNSDLGRLYQIANMVDVTLSLADSYEHVSVDKIKSSVSKMIELLNTIISIPRLNAQHKRIATELRNLITIKKTSDDALRKLEDVHTRLMTILNSESKKYV